MGNGWGWRCGARMKRGRIKRFRAPVPVGSPLASRPATRMSMSGGGGGTTPFPFAPLVAGTLFHPTTGQVRVQGRDSQPPMRSCIRGSRRNSRPVLVATLCRSGTPGGGVRREPGGLGELAAARAAARLDRAAARRPPVARNLPRAFGRRRPRPLHPACTGWSAPPAVSRAGPPRRARC